MEGEGEERDNREREGGEGREEGEARRKGIFIFKFISNRSMLPSPFTNSDVISRQP